MSSGIDRPPAGRKALAKLLDRAKNWWDRAAILAAIAYALGYASRALHAFDYNFGALPGARFEYLVAGFVLLLPSAVVAAALWALSKLATALSAWSKRHPSQSKRLQNVFGALWLISLMTFALVSGRETSFPHAGLVAKVFFILFVASIVINAILASGNAEKETLDQKSTDRHDDKGDSGTSRPAGFFGKLASYVLIAYFSLLGLLLVVLPILFGAILLREVPQEFGGVHPKCAVLDLERAKLSPELAAVLIGDDTSAQIARSHRLAVYSTSDPWLVRIPGDPSAENPRYRRSLRLSEDAVRSVEWVGKGSPPAEDGSTCLEDY